MNKLPGVMNDAMDVILVVLEDTNRLLARYTSMFHARVHKFIRSICSSEIGVWIMMLGS